MTSLNPLHPLQSGILECLARRQALSMEDLHRALDDEGVTASLPNLYRAVSQMIDVQMLVRNKGKVSLHNVWVTHLRSLADAATGVYGMEGEDQFFLAEGERREYAAESLGALDPIWFHVLLQCVDADADPEREWYAFNSHPWHLIGMNDTELRGYRAIAAKGVVCRMVYGNDGFLDKYALRVIKVPRFRLSINTDISLPKEGYAVWVCGEYIVECLFPDVLTRRFRHFFQEVKSMDQFDPELFADVFKMKARCKVILRRNKNDAQSLRMILKKS